MVYVTRGSDTESIWTCQRDEGNLVVSPLEGAQLVHQKVQLTTVRRPELSPVQWRLQQRQAPSREELCSFKGIAAELSNTTRLSILDKTTLQVAFEPTSYFMQAFVGPATVLVRKRFTTDMDKNSRVTRSGGWRLTRENKTEPCTSVALRGRF